MKVNDIFYSIQGESTFAGLPCVFVRLTGCNLRCKFCDTTFAYYDGFEISIDEIVQRAKNYNCKLVEITGGEPLLQPETPALAQRLLDSGFQVLVETNGSMDISALPSPIIRVVDIKCPRSGQSEKINWGNLHHLRTKDEVKFVITDRTDFDWAVSIVEKHHLLTKNPVLFSPAFEKLQPATLAQWILDTTLPIRLHLQQHKYILIK